MRLDRSIDGELWAERIMRGLVSVSTVTKLEVGYSARSGADVRRILSSPTMSTLLSETLTPAIEQRALEVQSLLADRGHHRAPSIPDLLIAATAELRSLTVLHLDKDFGLIADVTGQPIESLRIEYLGDREATGL
jgi:predicted nucleic acid-binding protein